MTDTIHFQSFPYLVGKKVSVSIAGLDCGDLTVAADGSLMVNYGADAGGLLTPGYLTSISSPGSFGDSETAIQITDAEGNVFFVNVPVVVGYAYTSQGQVPRPVLQEEMKTSKGSGTGKTRRIHRFSAFLWNAVKVKFGGDFNHLQSQLLLNPDLNTPLPESTPFTGIHEAPLDDTFSYDGMLCWQVDRPVPLGIMSVTSFVSTEEK